MSLKKDIDEIRNQLKKGAYQNEAAVSDRIVRRLLQTLEWPIFTPQIVIDEYVVEGRRVDFALCHPESTPRVFIEVKRVGNIDKGIKQLFEYAFHRGVSIVALTDGQKWRFYHPAGEGSYEDRKVAEIDLIAEDSEECSNYLDRYLNYESVKTGKAAKIIAEDYRIIVSQRKTEERLPEIWGELVQEKNKNLLQVVIEKTKGKIGHEPTEEQVLTFLKNLSVPSIKPPSSPIIVPDQPKEEKEKKLTFTRLRVTMDDGEIIEHETGVDTFVDVIEKIGIERIKDLGLIQNTIPLISTSKVSNRRQRQLGEYYITTGMMTKRKKRKLDQIAEGLGIDLKVELVDKV